MARAKALPESHKIPRADSAALGNPSVASNREGSIPRRPQHVERQLDNQPGNKYGCASKVSPNDKETGSSHDDFFAAAPNPPVENGEQRPSEDNRNRQEIPNGDSESSQSSFSQSNASAVGSALMQETAISPTATGGTAVIAATPPMRDLSCALTDNNCFAQPAPSANFEQDGLTAHALTTSTTTEPSDPAIAIEPTQFLLTQLKGNDAERAAYLPVAFTLNFGSVPVRPTDSQLLHLRNHLVWDMAANPQGAESDKLQVAQSRADSTLLQPAFNIKSPSLQALMRHTVAVEEKDDATSTLNSGLGVDGLGEHGSTGLGSFSLTSTKGRFAQSEPVRQTEETSGVRDVEQSAKRPVSQLVLKLENESDSSIAVRFSSRGQALSIDVLGGDQELRDSLRGSLPHLKNALEQHSLDGEWSATGALPRAESRLVAKEVAPASPFGPDTNQGHDGRSPHGSPKDGSNKEKENQARRGSKGELFSLTTHVNTVV